MLQESLEVIFVDYGNSDVVPIHNIMALKSDFRSLPYQVVWYYHVDLLYIT